MFDFKRKSSAQQPVSPTELVKEQGSDHGRPMYTPGTAEERALVRKIDLRLLYVIVVHFTSYLFNFNFLELYCSSITFH